MSEGMSYLHWQTYILRHKNLNPLSGNRSKCFTPLTVQQSNQEIFFNVSVISGSKSFDPLSLFYYSSSLSSSSSLTDLRSASLSHRVLQVFTYQIESEVIPPSSSCSSSFPMRIQRDNEFAFPKWRLAPEHTHIHSHVWRNEITQTPFWTFLVLFHHHLYF